MPAWAIMNMLRDENDEDEDLQRFVDSLVVFQL